MGTKKDYYVAIAAAEADDGGDEGGDTEPKGTGINKQAFFVTNDVFADWVELPVIKPQHLRESRRIRHLFTGELDAPVHTSPPFFGKERDLLKA